MDGVVYREAKRCEQVDEYSGWPPCVDFCWFNYARTALTNYEKEQDGKFEIVGLYPYTYQFLVLIPEIDESAGDCIHISFIAIPKGIADDGVPSQKLFFAELVCYGPGETKVTHCSILEPSDPGITFGCGICGPSEKIPHPSSGYLMGRWAYENGEIPDSVYASHWFKEEMVGGCKRLRLDLDKLFKGNVPTEYIQRRMKSCDFAEIALKLYKKGGDDVEFEVVEGLGYSRRSFVFIPEKSNQFGEWVHVNFTAKPKNAEDDFPPKLFFAELYDIGSANK